MSSSYRLELEKWLKQLDVKADKVLDVGGSQLPIKNRTRSWEVNKYLIADLEQPHVDSPKPDIIIDLNDNPENEKYFNLKWCNEHFDLVFCLEVFDYVWSPKDAMRWIYLLLNKGGEAWVTFPTVYPHHQPIEDDALRYMLGGITKLAKAVGLTIEEVIARRPETDAIDQLWRRERMRAAKHFDHMVTGYIVRFKK